MAIGFINNIGTASGGGGGGGMTDRSFNISAANWGDNSDPTTSDDYPYIYELSAPNIYNANSKPIWQMNGTGTLPTAEERVDINVIVEAVFTALGVTLYATDLPTNDLVLEAKGE